MNDIKFTLKSTFCEAIGLKSNKLCKNGSADIIVGAWDTSMIVYKTVPAQLEGKTFIERTVCVCPAHRASFHKRGALRVAMATPKHIEVINQIKEEVKVKNPQTNPCIGCMFPQECCTLPINVKEEKEVTSETKTNDFPFFCINCKQYHANANDLRICVGAPIVDQPLVKNTQFTWKTDSGVEIPWFPTMREAVEYCKTNVNTLIKPSSKGTGFNVFPTEKPYGDKRESNKSVLCGHCKQYHSSIDAVRACYGR